MSAVLGGPLDGSVVGPLIECVLDAVWIVERQGLSIVAVNEAAVQLLGLQKHELIGRRVTEFTASPEDIFFWEDVAAGHGQTIHSETRMPCGDGQTLQVERRISPMRIEEDGDAYMVCMRDRSQQRHMEDELELVLAEMQATLEATADGILVCNLDGGIAACNRRFAELWDVPEAMLVRRDDEALMNHMASLMVDSETYLQRLAQIASNPLGESSDVLVLRAGRLIERTTLPQHSQGRSIGRVYSYRDITQRIEAESGLRLAAKVFESSLDAIFIADAEHRIVAVNPGCMKLTRFSQDELVGRLAPELFRDAEEDGLFERVQQRWAHDGYWDGEALHARGDASFCPVQLSWVVLRDEHGEVRQSIGFFKDLTEMKATQQRIEQLAYTDLLTGLPNRLMLSQRVDFALRQFERDGGEFAVLFMDLDRFKNINDSLGHVFGDRVLVEVAQRIASCLRQVDTLCRLGGDEFVAYLHQADVPAAETVVRRILESLAQPFLVEEMHFSVSSSIGVAMFPADGVTLDELIKCADTAMYRVKERGRANFRFYQRQMNVEMLSRMKMDHAMRVAMETGLFRLVYQPQVSLHSGQVVGVEALIRWKDPDLGHVSPADFIPLAEETGYIVTIGSWVLAEAVRQAADWQRMGWPTAVSVNVSALQFQQNDFVERVAGVLEMSGLAPELLELELTESILVKDAAEALARLEALAALGVTLSIDDFGTGYSSLAYLKKFPIHKLKIDRSFISGLPEDENDHAIVSAIIQMGRALKLTIIAEGVETIAQRAMLQHLQCDQFQGYLCAPGMPADELERTMEAVRERAALSAA
jgi:diguanylate cyclase (GGDEF)-like protein/PAS domain S-box-containing protein